jgi:spore maturation protein CgeB
MTPIQPVRAILASEFWPGATARGIVPGLRDFGWLVDEIDIRQYVPPSHNFRSRVEGRLRHQERLNVLQRAILASAQTHNPDVFLTVKGVGIREDTLAALHHRGILLVNYYPDYHFDDIPLEAMANYDLVATTKSFQLDALKMILPPDGVALVHHGYGGEVHRPVRAPNQPPIDVLYIGNANPRKAALMLTLAEAMPNTVIRVVGQRWSKYARGTALARTLSGTALSGDFYAAEITTAKINLAFHMGKDPKTGFADLVSTRSFEIPACGGFMLHIDNDEIRSLYDVPSEIDTFASPEELIAKVRYWLDHPVERQEVAARGHARAVPAYSYFERGRELAQLVEDRLADRKDVSPMLPLARSARPAP